MHEIVKGAARAPHNGGFVLFTDFATCHFSILWVWECAFLTVLKLLPFLFLAGNMMWWWRVGYFRHVPITVNSASISGNIKSCTGRIFCQLERALKQMTPSILNTCSVYPRKFIEIVRVISSDSIYKQIQKVAKWVQGRPDRVGWRFLHLLMHTQPFANLNNEKGHIKCFFLFNENTLKKLTSSGFYFI